MDLKTFATATKYLNWNESDTHHIALSITFDEFCKLEPLQSDKYDSDQYEIPIVVLDNKQEPISSLLATKSKALISDLLLHWSENENYILKVSKRGGGFNTKYTVISTDTIYIDGKIKKYTGKKE